VKEKMILDKTHEQYGIEEEDILKLKKGFNTLGVQEQSLQLAKLLREDEEAHGAYGTDVKPHAQH